MIIFDKIKKKSIYFSLFFLFLYACKSDRKKIDSPRENTPISPAESVILPETLNTKIHHAQNFKLYKQNNLRHIQVSNTWKKGGGDFEYVLYPREQSPPNGFPEKTIFIPIPVKRTVCLSTTHAAFIAGVGEANSLVGITNPEYLYDSRWKKMIDEKKLMSVGNEKINYEQIIALKPDIVFAYGLPQETTQIEKLRSMGLPVVVVAEFMEKTPLARAEWLRFFASFYNRDLEVQKMFRTIVTEYDNLKKTAIEKVNKRPTVFTGTMFQGVWYVPAGESFLAEYIRDAAGDYLWKDTQGAASLSLNFEKVFLKAFEADIWIDVGNMHSLKEMLNADLRYGKFAAFQNKEVYNFDARLSPNGGFDIYESGAIQPHLVLKDLIKIFHPSLFEEHPFYYYKKLE